MKRKNKRLAMGIIALMVFSSIIVSVVGKEDEYEIIFDKGEDCKCEGLESLGIELVNCEASKYTTYTDGKADKYSGLRCVYAKQTYGPSGLDREVSIEMEIKCYKTVEEASDKFWEQANDYGKWDEKWDPTKPEKYEVSGIPGAAVRNEGSNTRLSFIQKIPFLKNADTGEVRLDYSGETFFRYSEKYIIDIHGWAESSIFVQALDILERHAKAIIDGRKKISFTLKHYDPFYGVLEESTMEVPGAPQRGELRAILKKEDGGNDFSGRKVFFYVEPGTYFEDVLKFPGTVEDWDWIRILPSLNVKQENYLGWDNIDNKGIASINYIEHDLVRSEAFSKSLIKNKDKVEGIIKAVVVNVDKTPFEIEYKTSINVKFDCLAMITGIRGDGWPDSGASAECKDGICTTPPSVGPGRVRVKSPIFKPSTPFLRVDLEDDTKFKGVKLMPGDIINIDGGTNIKIMWVNGDIVVAKVPQEEKVKRMVSGQAAYIPSLDIVLMPTASWSGFATTTEEWTSPLRGLTVSKGIDFLIKSIPHVGRVAKLLVIDVRNTYKKVDLSKVDVITSIRVRSKVIVEQEDEEIEVYTIEGSPDIKTVKGEEVTLKDGEMVTVSEDGTLSEVQSFDPEKDLEEWSEYLQSSDSEEPSGPSLPSLGKLLPIIVIIVVIIIGALVAIPKMKREKPIKTQRKGLHCPNCGTVNYEEDMFCVNCGAKLQKEGFFCPNCGAENKEDSMFCVECGEKFR